LSVVVVLSGLSALIALEKLRVAVSEARDNVRSHMIAERESILQNNRNVPGIISAGAPEDGSGDHEAIVEELPETVKDPLVLPRHARRECMKVRLQQVIPVERETRRRRERTVPGRGPSI